MSEAEAAFEAGRAVGRMEGACEAAMIPIVWPPTDDAVVQQARQFGAEQLRRAIRRWSAKGAPARAQEARGK